MRSKTGRASALCHLGIVALFSAGYALSLTHASGATVINLATPVGGQISDLVDYYALNSSTGSTATDSAGSFNGTLSAGNGTLPAWVGGVNAAGTSGYGNGLYFSNPTFSNTTKQGNVVTAATTLSTPMDLAGTDFTLGTWIKMNSINAGVAQSGWLMDKKGGSGSTAGWAFALSKNTGGAWNMSLYSLSVSGTNTQANSVTFSAPNDLQWHELGVSFDNTSHAVVFYLDGTAISNAGNNITGFAASTSALMIGQRNSTGSSLGTTLDMTMDDVFVSNGLHTFAAVPEPSTVALVGLAGGVVLFFRRRK